MKSLLLLPFLLLLGCANLDLKPDPNPSPADPLIAQARMEFSGCSRDQQIGQIVCRPGEKLQVRTEFPGFLIYFSNSSDALCSLREDRRATQPTTEIALPKFDRVCSITVYYLPDYPRAQRSLYPIRGVWGEVTVEPTFSWLGHQAVTDREAATVQLPEGTQRGYWISRQHTEPQAFQGDKFSVVPTSVGIELIQIKYWDQAGEPHFTLQTVNFFSFRSLLLQPDVTKDKKLRIEFPAEVSIVTYGDKISTCRKLSLPLNYTGTVRAYTVQGRTAVLRITNGLVEEL